MSRSFRLIMSGWLMATFLVMFLLSKPTPVSVAAQATMQVTVSDPAPSVAIPGEWASDELTLETQERGQGRFSIKFTVEADPHEPMSGKRITSATTQVSACGYAFALDLVAKRTPYLFWDEFELIGYSRVPRVLK